MSRISNTSRLLGAAFLLQATTSLISGLILAAALIVPGDISSTMLRIAGRPWMMRGVILGEMVTISGVILLAAILFVVLRQQHEIIALTALGLYVLEAAIGAIRLVAGSSLLRVSLNFAREGRSLYSQDLASMLLESLDSAYKLMMLPFCVGAIIFYYLLYRSRLVPAALSLWGLMAVFPVLLGTVLTILGFQPSLFLYLPYIPFEFVIGIWILIKGLNEVRFKETLQPLTVEQP